MEPLAEDDPRQVGGFRLQARLGAGGMGRVYLGYSPGGRPVAVKVVHPELTRDPEFMHRFRREVAAAQAVSDAYTAAVVGAGPDDSPPWLATTYVAGPSLAELVARAGTLPEDAVWRLAGGLAEALQAIHAQGLVHRDLKPGNILIAADGPRVIDFGISRTTSGTVVTATQMTVGTPAYMSPEQAEGRTVGPASDVFSLGSVLAFAATGAAPFGGGGEMFAVAFRVVHGEPDLSQVPVSLRPLIEACLTKNPAGRPALDGLMQAVAVSSATYPAVTPGRFWPDQVAALVDSSEFTPALPPLAPTPPPGSAPAPVTYPGRPGQYAPTELSAVAAGAGIAIALAVSPSRTPPAFLSPTASGAASASGTASAPASTSSGSPAASASVSPFSGAPSSGPAPASVSASGSGTAPAAGAGPASGSPDATTVCTAPAAGCTRAMAARPGQITLSADGSRYVNSLTWDSWGGAQATGEGTLYVNNCQPDCASGKFTGYVAQVTLSGLTPYGKKRSGLEAYASITVQAPSAPTKTYTFPKALPAS